MTRSFAAIIASACLCVATADVAGAQVAGPQFLAFAFTSEQHGWAAGASGIDVTNDGGHHWSPQYRGGRVDQIQIVRRRFVFALHDGQLLRTTDGGAHWVSGGTALPALKQMAFATERDGFGVGTDGSLMQTTDSGTSWHHASLNKPVDAVCFSDALHGYAGGAGVAPALGAFDGIAATSDGGRTWSPAMRPPTDGQVGIAGHTLHCTGGAVWDLVDFGAHAGGGAYLLALSTDGSRSWKPIVTGGQTPAAPHVARGPGAEATSMSAYSPSVAYIAGFCGACGARGQSSFGATLDNGKTWNNMTIDALGFTSAPVFTTPSHGWIGARALSADAKPVDEVLETRDGGRTWTPIAVL